MPLEHEPLGVAERRRLAQQLLGDRELAEIVEARRRAGSARSSARRRRAGARSAPRTRRHARMAGRCTRRARRSSARGSRRRGSGPRGRGCRRAARGSRAGTTPPRTRARGSCRPPSPSRAQCRRAGSARLARLPASGRSRTPPLTVTSSMPSMRSAAMRSTIDRATALGLPLASAPGEGRRTRRRRAGSASPPCRSRDCDLPRAPSRPSGGRAGR